MQNAELRESNPNRFIFCPPRNNAPMVQFMSVSSIHDEINSCRKAIHFCRVRPVWRTFALSAAPTAK
jgi:hypothetical protein